MSIPIQHDLRIFSDIDDLAVAAAKDFAERARAAVMKKGEFTVALSGGNTPKALFDVLAKMPEVSERTSIPWSRVQIFWGDERFVSHDDPRSNFFMAQEHLLSKVQVNPKNIHAIPTDSEDPNIAALRYANILRDSFRLKEFEIPKFDLIYLGLGPDGHTASLFPETDVVNDIINGKLSETQLVAALWVEKFKMHRISLLPAVINHAECVAFLVAGDDKAAIVKTVMSGKYQPKKYPSQLIRPLNNHLIWFVDQAAVSVLDGSR